MLLSFLLLLSFSCLLLLDVLSPWLPRARIELSRPFSRRRLSHLGYFSSRGVRPTLGVLLLRFLPTLHFFFYFHLFFLGFIFFYILLSEVEVEHPHS